MRIPKMSVARRRARWLQWANAYQAGESCEAIAAKHGLGRTAVFYALKKLGVPMRATGSVKGSTYRVKPKPKPYYPLLREQRTMSLKNVLSLVRAAAARRQSERRTLHALALLIDMELRFRNPRRKPIALPVSGAADTKGDPR